MEVEGVKAQKKALFYALAATFLLIVGLIVTIIILGGLKNQNTETPTENTDAYTTQSMDIYEVATNEILERTEGSEDINDTIAMYRVYIAKTTDGGAKALLYTDYYMILMSLDTSLSMKDEVLSGLIDADNTIKNASSALAVSNAATYYQDYDLSNKYQDLAKNRMEEEK